jgi:ribonuclease HI
MIKIYTDGACKVNPGTGGWAAIIQIDSDVIELVGYEPMTTNNRMEMMAVISGLEYVRRNSVVHVVSDSQYVVNGATKWMAAWERKNWVRNKNESVKNVDLWQRMKQAIDKHKVTFEWVRGHNGHYQNERADLLANKAIMDGINGCTVYMDMTSPFK